MNELIVKTINFNGDSLLAIKENDKVYIGINNICCALGLDARIQRDKLKVHATLSKGCALRYIPSSGGNQEAFTIELNFLPIWLAGINPARVSPECKDKLIEYQLKAKDVLAQAFLNNKPALPSNFAEACRMLADEWEEKQKLLPKAQSYDQFISANNNQDMNKVAKTLGIGRNKLFALLRAKEVLRKDNTPYQKFIDRGYFEVKEKPIAMGGQVINKVQTYVTAKGVDWLSDKLIEWGNKLLIEA